MAHSKGLLNNMAWKFSERVASQLVSFVVSIVLARLLMPSDYGAIAMVMVFITLAQVLVDGGFSGALIQKKNADKLDFSTVFYFVLAVSLLLYVILWFTAPYIADFYGKEYEILTPVFRVLGIQVIIYGVNSIQQAYVSREMMFKKFFYATLAGTIISGCVGLLMAYNGYGIWSLVGQQLTMSVVNTFTLFLVTRKLPALIFSWGRLKILLGFGIKLFGASLLVAFYQEVRSLIIGKVYSSKELAFFERGKTFPSLLVNNINSSIGAVLFPKLSQQQDDLLSVKSTTRHSIRFSTYVLCPLMLGLAAVAEPLIHLLLTEKWMPCVPYMQVLCVAFVFMPIHTANMQAIKAIGRSDIIMILEVVKKVIELVTLLMVMRMGVLAIAINMAVLNFAFIFINAYPNVKNLNYSLKEQLLDVFPNFLVSGIMAGIVLLIGVLPLGDLPLLIIQVIVGGIFYWGISKLIKNPEYQYIVKLIKNKINTQKS